MPIAPSAQPAPARGDLVSQIAAEIIKNQPGLHTTEFALVALLLVADIVLGALNKIPASLSVLAGGFMTFGYQWLRNNRKDDRESSILNLLDVVAQSAGLVLPPSAPAPSGPLASIPAAVLVAFLLAGLALSGCGTTAGIAVANALESPANQAIIAAGVNAGVLSLESSLGGKVPESMQAPLATVASTAGTGLVTGLIFAGAEALRTKQSTAKSASPGALTFALVNQADLPPTNATTIAKAVSSLAAQGIPPDIANEAVARTLDATAAAKTSPAGKTIVPPFNQTSNVKPQTSSASLDRRALKVLLFSRVQMEDIPELWEGPPLRPVVFDEIDLNVFDVVLA